MCANMFDVRDKNNNHCVVMSKRARNAFTEKNLTELNQNYKLVVSDVDIIEAIGGGSCRCMLVELSSSHKSQPPLLRNGADR